MKPTSLFKLLYTIGIVYSINGNSQTKSFSYEQPSENYFKTSRYFTSYTKDIAALIKQAYPLENSLPVGYVTDGSVDYTEFLQEAINNHKNIVFPDFPVLVNSKGLSLIGNSKVLFKKKSAIILKANNLSAYAIVRIFDVQNVMVYFPVIIGDRKLHGGDQTSQWGMGLSIKGAKNVKIFNPKISECWGDGIYIGSMKDRRNEDIGIYDAWLDHNRRNGISIITGRAVNIINPVVTNTFGHMPMSGIDIEPNTNEDEIRDILIDKPVTFNSAMHGIVVSLGGLMGKNQKTCSIRINDHKDTGSNIGFGLQLTRKKNLSTGPEMKGLITVDNATWVNNTKKGFQYYKSPQNGLNVVFKNTKILTSITNGKQVDDEKSLKELSAVSMTDQKIQVK